MHACAGSWLGAHTLTDDMGSMLATHGFSDGSCRAPGAWQVITDDAGGMLAKYYLLEAGLVDLSCRGAAFDSHKGGRFRSQRGSHHACWRRKTWQPWINAATL